MDRSTEKLKTEICNKCKNVILNGLDAEHGEIMLNTEIIKVDNIDNFCICKVKEETSIETDSIRNKVISREKMYPIYKKELVGINLNCVTDKIIELYARCECGNVLISINDTDKLKSYHWCTKCNIIKEAEEYEELSKKKFSLAYKDKSIDIRVILEKGIKLEDIK